MSEQEKLLQTIIEYEKTMQQLNLPVDKFQRWKTEIFTGHVLSSDLTTFLTNMIAYEREKDRSFTSYLEGLLK